MFSKPVLLSFGAASFYALSSVSISMVNKNILSGYGFEGFFSLMLLQLLLSLAVCITSRELFGNPLAIPRLRQGKLLWAAAPMSALFVGNVGFGLVGLKLVNVPLFFAIRRLVAPVVLAYEYVALGRVPSLGVQLAVLIIVIGTLLACWESLSVDLWGYSITMLNNVISAALTVTQKQFSEKHKMTALGIVYCQAALSAPIALFLLLASGEVATVRAFPHLDEGAFLGGLALSCSMGIVLSFSSMLSTTFNSPLATSITGNVKDIGTTLIGGLLFSGFKPSFLSIAGLLLSFVGAFIYSWVQLPGRDGKEAGAVLPTILPGNIIGAEDGTLSATGARSDMVVVVADTKLS